MLKVNENNKTISGIAIVRDIKKKGLVEASLFINTTEREQVSKEQAMRRIRTYSGVELVGKQLFNQLGVDIV
jgi:hypothetical protein